MSTTRAEKKADIQAEKLARKEARLVESARKKAKDEAATSARQRARAVRTEQKAAKKRGSNRGDLRRSIRLFRRFKGSPKIYVVGITLLVFEAATAVIEPIPIAWLIDFLGGKKPNLREMGGPALLSSERFETILVLTLAVVLIAAINSAADSLTEICMARGGRSLGYSIRTAMYSHLQRLPLAYHDSKRTGDVLTRVTGDVLVVEEFIVKSVSNIIGSLLVLVGSFTLLMFQSWRVALVSLVVVPLLAFVSRNFSLRIKKASKEQRGKEGELASTAQEMLTSIRLVQSYGRGTVDLHRFSDQTAKSMHASVKASNIQAQFSFVIALVEALAISAVVWLGVWLVDRNAITIGTLVLFILVLGNMFKPARKIISEWYKIGKVYASVERIDDLLDRRVMVEDLPDAVEAPELQGHLRFNHVGFTYPAEHADGTTAASRPTVLEDIDFEVAPGEVVSLVGPSGAGKSTVAQLIPRLYDPDQGEVLIDGIAIRNITLASLRSQVSLVLQETILLAGSVAENIAYGIEGATQEDVEAAAKLANAHDFILELPDGYETNLGERGSTLSGGQRQRLAIARAFIRRAPLLILDEPTTGLDHESAEIVVDALAELMRGKTTVVISHDPGLIQRSDRILTVSGGRIVESNRPDKTKKQAPALSGTVAKKRRRALDKAVVAPVATGTRKRVPMLVESIHKRLPGLVKAMDETFVADQVANHLLATGASVDGADVGKVWLREDGTCTLSYRLRVVSASGGSSEHTVLGRVLDSDDAASEYVQHSVRRMTEMRAGVSGPWQESSAVATGAGLALHPFPIDPALPTLIPATNPSVVSNLVKFSGIEELPTAETVHHPREGACVLRYRFPGTDMYGKVYGDDSGDAIARNLKALTRGPDGMLLEGPVRYPRPVVYSASLRLLITEALPGAPLVPSLLKSILSDTPPRTVKENKAQTDALRDAVRVSAEALAALHTTTAPASVHSMSDDLAGLRRELDVVGTVWPEVADDLRGRVDGLFWNAPDVPNLVLSHGDFTPSQVLIEGGSAAIVDLDTLCWADPALDLGRYLAHLDVLATKLSGHDARPLVDDLSEAFVESYSAAAPATSAGIVDRVGFYRALTLTRTAVHACRQTKDRRLDVALSLLDTVHADNRPWSK
jgi:ABC-type multidrug transport system fused ATPase/permease subunit